MYNTTIPWDFKDRFQDGEGNLTLHSDKSYFDYLSSEFKRETIEKKALTLARLIYFGLDLPNYVKGYKERKSDYITSTLSDTLLRYIQTLRWGETIHDTTNFMLDNMDDNDLAILLQEELKVRYTIWEGIGEDRLIFSRWRDKMLCDMALLVKNGIAKTPNILVTADFSREYKDEVRVPKEKFNLKNDKTMTREEVIAQNPWVEVAAKIQKCIDTKNWYCEGGFVCKDDVEKIKAHNEKCDNSKSKHKKRCKYITDVVSYAHSGNVLEAQIVILTLNPGYREIINKTTFDIFCEESKKTLYQDRINGFTFNAKKMIESPEDSIIGGHYWDKKLSPLWEDEGFARDLVLERVSLLQSVGYRSTEFAKFSNIEDFSGVAHIKRIIQYLSQDQNRLFIIARKSDFWDGLLKDNGVANERIITLKSARNSTISRGNMSEEDFEKISNVLKE